MSEIAFLSFDSSVAGGGHEPWPRSPLDRVLATRPSGIEDISLSTGKIEVRGAVAGALDVDGAEILNVTPARALVLCRVEDTARIRDRLRDRARVVVDLTGALAGLRIEHPVAEQLMRRITDLDLDALPAVGSVARVRTYVLRDDRTVFRLFCPQELGHHVAEVVVDVLKGLEG